jgi:CheY-like chemotaxis protein/predicted Zn-ribbon and HTH transcriptional regulator
MSRIVLLADDLDDLRMSLAELLTDHGYAVVRADSRAEALGRAPEADVILVNRSLTEDGALDVVRELHGRSDTKDVPILIHVAEEDEVYRRQALEAGARAVLVRPLDRRSLLNELEKLCPPASGQGVRDKRYIEERSEEELIRFLTKLLDERVPAVRAEYNPQSPAGYAYPLAEEFFNLPSREAIRLLEDLVSEGLLDRRLAYKINLCPTCGWHTLNIIEVCPRCKSIDIEIESVVHHFACAHVGAWSDFKQGADLVCPKCDAKLRQIGMDYEKPGDTYVCKGCGYAFTDSKVIAKCLRCGHECPAEAAIPAKIYDYAPNARTSRAVEYGHIYGLNIESVLYHDRSRTYRRDFVLFEIDRERYRSLRYESPLSIVLMNISGLEKAAGTADAVDLAAVQREISEKLTDTLRDLDLVSAADERCTVLLLPETPLQGALAAAKRIQDMIFGLQSVNMRGEISITAVAGELKPEHDSGREFFDAVYQALLWAIEHRPGIIVTVDECQRETRNA